MAFKIRMFLLEFYAVRKAAICLTQLGVPKQGTDC